MYRPPSCPLQLQQLVLTSISKTVISMSTQFVSSPLRYLEFAISSFPCVGHSQPLTFRAFLFQTCVLARRLACYFFLHCRLTVVMPVEIDVFKLGHEFRVANAICPAVMVLGHYAEDKCQVFNGASHPTRFACHIIGQTYCLDSVVTRLPGFTGCLIR